MSDTATLEPPAETKTTSGNQPVYKIRFGNISAALFADEVSNKDGEIYTRNQIALQKSWKTKTGDYDDRTMYLNRDDVMKVISALQQTYLAMHDEANA